MVLVVEVYMLDRSNDEGGKEAIADADGGNSYAAN